MTGKLQMHMLPYSMAPNCRNIAVMDYNLPQILTSLKIKTLNEMQQAALKAASEDNEIILLSDTGSGKTLAFLLPLLSFIDETLNSTQALVIVPSRELAIQIEQVFKAMGTGLKVTCCYGGHLRETEENNLLEAPALIIGTPGRLSDHLRRGNIKTNAIKTLVLDEFDKSLELGFHDEVSFITGELKAVEKRILTSATLAVEIPAFIGLSHPARLNFLSNEPAPMLEIKLLRSDDKDKLEILFRLICKIGSQSMVIFLNHRESVQRTSEFLSSKGLVNVFYHGALEQQERDSALCKFRNGTSDILVTTDLAARGLDIPNIRYIIHYHLPATEEVFTHRNGRTARMHASGTAVLIVSPEESVPAYIEDATYIELPQETVLPDKPKWSTLFIAAGKKNKVNKIDIVGFLGNKGGIRKEDIGLIEVKDFHSFVAVRKSKMSGVLHLIQHEKIKNKKVKIEIAK